MGRNLLKRAAEVIQTRLESHGSEIVEYERPGVGLFTTLAIVGRTEYEQDTQSGFIARMIRNDYTIRRSNLVIDGEEIVPERNDIIRQTLDNGDVYEGRVLGESGIPHFEDADAFGVAVTIHTKRDE